MVRNCSADGQPYRPAAQLHTGSALDERSHPSVEQELQYCHRPRARGDKLGWVSRGDLAWCVCSLLPPLLLLSAFYLFLFLPSFSAPSFSFFLFFPSNLYLN